MCISNFYLILIYCNGTLSINIHSIWKHSQQQQQHHPQEHFRPLFLYQHIFIHRKMNGVGTVMTGDWLRIGSGSDDETNDEQILIGSLGFSTLVKRLKNDEIKFWRDKKRPEDEKFVWHWDWAIREIANIIKNYLPSAQSCLDKVYSRIDNTFSSLSTELHLQQQPWISSTVGERKRFPAKSNLICITKYFT